MIVSMHRKERDSVKLQEHLFNELAAVVEKKGYVFVQNEHHANIGYVQIMKGLWPALALTYNFQTNTRRAFISLYKGDEKASNTNKLDSFDFDYHEIHEEGSRLMQTIIRSLICEYETKNN